MFEFIFGILLVGAIFSLIYVVYAICKISSEIEEKEREMENKKDE